jgi:hypothetical protein
MHPRLVLHSDNLHFNVKQLSARAIVFKSTAALATWELHLLEETYMRLSVKWTIALICVALCPPAETQAADKHAPVSSITQASFGFQCGTGRPTNCPNATWPATIAQPGMIRLWDSQVQWAALNIGHGDYNWKTLDRYLDTIAAHQPRDAMYTFGYTPCWDTTRECEPAWGSKYPPDDLTSSGSPSFNSFVLALVTHCSAARHCVKDYIKYWEMWNEANAPNRWGGSIPQLYQLMAPAIATIRSKIPGALILTPPVNRGDTDWMQEWLALENKSGRLSDIFSFHLYLQNADPESRFDMVQQMVALKNNTSGWADTPWMNSETSFNGATFLCDSKYSADDCLGQILRWHLLHFAYGAQQLSWFYFNATIGHNPDYSDAYHQMMNWLIGGHFTAPCSDADNIYICPFVQANGHRALFAWSPSGSKLYTPVAQYADYKSLDGNSTTVSPKRPITIGVKPIMLEAAN